MAQLEKLSVFQIKKKYDYASSYLCHKILMEELESVEVGELVEDPVGRMISEKKVNVCNHTISFTYTT